MGTSDAMHIGTSHCCTPFSASPMSSAALRAGVPGGIAIWLRTGDACDDSVPALCRECLAGGGEMASSAWCNQTVKNVAPLVAVPAGYIRHAWMQGSKKCIPSTSVSVFRVCWCWLPAGLTVLMSRLLPPVHR